MSPPPLWTTVSSFSRSASTLRTIIPGYAPNVSVRRALLRTCALAKCRPSSSSTSSASFTSRRRPTSNWQRPSGSRWPAWTSAGTSRSRHRAVLSRRPTTTTRATAKALMNLLMRRRPQRAICTCTICSRWRIIGAQIWLMDTTQVKEFVPIEKCRKRLNFNHLQLLSDNIESSNNILKHINESKNEHLLKNETTKMLVNN